MSTRRQAVWLSSFLCVSATLLQAQHGGQYSGSAGSHSSGIGHSAISPYHSPASIGLSPPSIGISPPSIGLSGPTITNRFRGQYPSLQGDQGVVKRNGDSYVNGPWRRGSRNGRYAYALPFAYFGPPYYSSYDGDPGAAPVDVANPSDDGGLSNQVQQLSTKIDQLQSQLSQQSGSTPVEASSEQTPPAPPITVVLNDGRTLEVQNYAVVGNVFWDFSNQPARKIPLSNINLAASAKASETNGAEFPQVTVSR